MSAITRLAQWLNDENLLVGWSLQYARYLDERDQGERTVIIQQLTQGSGDVYLQRYNLELIFIGASPEDVVTVQQKADEVARAARVESAGGADIVKVSPDGNARGPRFFADNRPVMELRISIWTEDL